MTSVRKAAVAGMFYPGNAKELEATVRDLLSRAESAGSSVPKAIIAPHAGYVYSGAVAAAAYARILPAAGRITRVVLFGPCHKVPVRGLAVSGADGFSTPLGTVPIDAEARNRILQLPRVQVFDDTHAQEHSLEVHLPFLQVMLDQFDLVPIVVGQATAKEVADVMDALWGGPETLIVVSSDLSHYLSYDEARSLDRDTCDAIERLDPDGIGQDQACGRVPVSGLLELAKRRGLNVSTIDLCNSGDTAGSRDRVVGYGAWVFTEGSPTENKDDAEKEIFGSETRALLARHGVALLHLAAASIEYGLNNGHALPIDPADHDNDLSGHGACFVTLKRKGKLRGCIGSPRAHRSLVVDVAENSYSAAFSDRRFSKLRTVEKRGLSVSISLLSDSFPMRFTDEADLLRQMRPGTDGLIIADKKRRSLFLPAVWNSLPVPSKFLTQLKVKAGLGANHWSAEFKAWRFITVDISTSDLDNPALVWSGYHTLTRRHH